MRESARAKSLRYLAEGRLRILDCHEDEGRLSAEARGNGCIYIVSHDPETGWSCDCRARGENCCHVLACKAVTVFQPRESRP
jgi:hypothetical protein